ncbi:ATP-dependent endonuclease [Planctomycetota bacterium]
MSNPRNILQNMFREQHRYANFGNMLIQIRAEGFRCHSGTTIDIESPITALSGLNGTGKSTLLQLSAIGYKNVGDRRYFVKDFLVVGSLDPNPFDEFANVRYRYWKDDRSFQTVTISHNSGTRKWSGYQRRPERHITFAGAGPYLQRIENRDFVVRYAQGITVESTSLAEGSSCVWTSRILSRHYDEVNSNVVRYGTRTGRVASVQRAGICYSEAHMGCGEGRVHFLVDTLESAPDKSLILIEEPEASLHPSAEYEFGQYLVDVCIRKRHQIILATHSEYILQSLPQASRMHFDLNSSGLQLTPGLTARQVKSLLTQGRSKALTVLVEDKRAKAILVEIVRRVDTQFLQTIDICVCGGSANIAQTVRTLNNSSLPMAAVRDGDQPEIPSENIFKLPGNEPPEKEIFKQIVVREYISETYGISWDDFVATLPGIHHHEWLARLAQRIDVDAEMLLGEIARVYASAITESEAVTLINLLKETSQ